jgi:hypothetical protein
LRISSSATGLLVVGLVIGLLATRVLGLHYREPVALVAVGAVSLRLDGAPDFVARETSDADCRSVPDSWTVYEVVGVNLGDLRGRSLRARLLLLDPYLEIWADGAELPPGAPQPSWEGQIASPEMAADRRQGSAFFGLELVRPPTPSHLGDWPASLSGTLTWRCGEWLAPSSEEPSVLDATVNIGLVATDWLAVPDAQGACATSHFGVVAWLSVADVGRLQGAAVQVEVDINEGLRDGRRMYVWIRVAPPPHKQLPPGADFLPSWNGLAEVVELAPDGRTGRVAFDQLGTGVDPTVGQPPAGWPASVTGELSWSCN